MKLAQNLSLYFAVLSFFCPSLSFDLVTERTLDFVIQNYYMDLNKLAGFGLAVVKIDENGVPDTLAKGYGLRDLENQRRADSSTLFAIGSISKTFTATIVVKVLSEKYPELGESVLDIPIRTLLPSLNFTLSDRFLSEYTSFRDLLSHRSCVHPGGPALVLGYHQNKEEFLYRMRYAEEVCPFRTAWVYNNNAFFMAGEIIAKIADSTFEILLSDFLRDLGMNNTIFVRESDDYNTMPNMSRGYYNDKGAIKRYNSNLLKWIAVSPAPGGILSSSEDMLKYLMFHINNGKVGDRQVVSEVAIKYIRQSSVPVLGRLATKINPDDSIVGYTSYGVGLMVGILDGWEFLSHTGTLPPYSSYLSFYPTLKLGIFSVTNGPNRTPDVLNLHKIIYDVIENDLRSYEIDTKPKYSHLLPSELHGIPNSKPEVKSMNARNTFHIENIVGLYGNGYEGEFVISQVNGSEDGLLYIRYGVWGTGTLRLISESNYNIDWDSDIVQLFTFSGWQSQTIDFGQENLAILSLSYDGTDEIERIVFQKNLTLDKLPSQPWDPDSCGPS